jgi:hypothetical protein
MNPDLEKALIAYAQELAGNGPVVNYSHHTLRRLWDTYGREAVDAGIATLPEFKVPCRRPYSIGVDPAVPPMPNWRAVVGSLLCTLQEDDYTLERVDDGGETITVSGTPREQRQQAKSAIVAVDTSHLYVSKNGKTFWLFIVLGNAPEETVCDYTSNEDLEKTLDKFISKWEGRSA